VTESNDVLQPSKEPDWPNLIAGLTGPKKREAGQWLVDYLLATSEHAALSKTIKVHAKLAGHTESTLNEARNALGIQSFSNQRPDKLGYWRGGSLWSLELEAQQVTFGGSGYKLRVKGSTKDRGLAARRGKRWGGEGTEGDTTKFALARTDEERMAVVEEALQHIWNGQAQQSDLDELAADRREMALYYCGLGWRVMRVHGLVLGPDRKLICSCHLGSDCKDTGKHPVDGMFQFKATSDQDVVNRWWDAYPEANIGLAMGRGMIVVDLDVPKKNDKNPVSGIDVWNDIVALNSPIPQTLTARTGSGGKHLYYSEPLWRKTGNAKKGTALEGSKKIDLKGWGGFVVAPPSLHYTGKPYRWETLQERIQMADWFYERPAKLVVTPKRHTEKVVLPKNLQQARQRVTNKGDEDEGLSSAVLKKFDELWMDVDRQAVLPQRTDQLIRRGNSDEDDQSRIIFSIVVPAARARFHPLKLFDLLCDPFNVGGKGLRSRLKTRGGEAGLDWFLLNWKNAQLVRAEEYLAVEELGREVDRYDWSKTMTFADKNGEIKRVQGPKVKKVLETAISIGLERTSISPMVGRDQVFDRTEIRQITVRKAMIALAEHGWWTPEVPRVKGKGSQAWVLNFNFDPTRREETMTLRGDE